MQSELNNGEELTIVLTDYEMPILSGTQSIKEIKAFYNQINQRIIKKNKQKHENYLDD